MLNPKGKKSAGRKGNNPLGPQQDMPLGKQDDLLSDDDHAHIDHNHLEEDSLEKESKTKKPKLDNSSNDGKSKRTTGQERKGKGKMSRTREPSKATPTTEGVAPEGWSGQDVTFFRILQPIYGHNYCVMAEVMTKSCYEVKLLIIVIKAHLISYVYYTHIHIPLCTCIN